MHIATDSMCNGCIFAYIYSTSYKKQKWIFNIWFRVAWKKVKNSCVVLLYLKIYLQTNPVSSLRKPIEGIPCLFFILLICILLHAKVFYFILLNQGSAIVVWLWTLPQFLKSYDRVKGERQNNYPLRGTDGASHNPVSLKVAFMFPNRCSNGGKSCKSSLCKMWKKKQIHVEDYI